MYLIHVWVVSFYQNENHKLSQILKPLVKCNHCDKQRKNTSNVNGQAATSVRLFFVHQRGQLRAARLDEKEKGNIWLP